MLTAVKKIILTSLFLATALWDHLAPGDSSEMDLEWQDA